MTNSHLRRRLNSSHLLSAQPC